MKKKDNRRNPLVYVPDNIHICRHCGAVRSNRAEFKRCWSCGKKYKRVTVLNVILWLILLIPLSIILLLILTFFIALIFVIIADLNT